MTPYLKLLAPLAGLCAASGCANLPEQPAGDWLEVPLAENTWWEQGSDYREAAYSIPLASGEALEHKITMQADDIVVYTWTVAMADPSLLTAEFHGHTERVGEEPGTVMFYKVHQDGRESGALRAPFTGIHGWYFNNQSDEDIVVELRVAGFFAD